MTALLLLAVACATPDQPLPPPTAEVSVSHPGTITFVDLDSGEERTEDASSVPESIAWYSGGGSPVPVVRVESAMRGTSREIKRYGPDGALLDTTVSAPRR